MSDPRTANGHRRRQVKAWLRAQQRPCWICVAFGKAGYIDYSLPPGHPMSFEVDELIPVSKGGSPTARSNVDAAHRCCNQWRGNRSVEEVMRIAAIHRTRSGDVRSVPQALGSVRGKTSELSD